MTILFLSNNWQKLGRSGVNEQANYTFKLKTKVNMIKLQYILIIKNGNMDSIKKQGISSFLFLTGLIFLRGGEGGFIHSLISTFTTNSLKLYFTSVIIYWKKIKKNWSIMMCTPTYTHSQHVLEICIHAHAHVCSHIRYVMLSLVTKKLKMFFIPKNLI